MKSQLITANELNSHLDDANYCVIDCRFDLFDTEAGRKQYSESHIPGAVYMDLNLDLASEPTPTSGRHPLPDVAATVAAVRKAGIGNDTQVVVYDSGSGAIAARAWWILRWLGHTSVRLLDGGFAAWAAGYPLSSDVVEQQESDFIAAVQSGLVVTTADIAENSADVAALNLTDARDAARFKGDVEPIDRVAGHIPGARNLPFASSLNQDGRWKSREELRALWRDHLGDDPSADWVAMCGSGVTACHLAISALEAGYREPRVYIGSWSEWITNPERPIGRD